MGDQSKSEIAKYLKAIETDSREKNSLDGSRE